jgi:hypothetical protein
MFVNFLPEGINLPSDKTGDYTFEKLSILPEANQWKNIRDFNA